MRERDRTETRCAHCGELFGADPDAHVIIKVVTGGPSFCRQKGIGHGNRIKRCRRLEGHEGRHVFKGKGDFISPKHLQRYVAEFATRHNLRPQDTATMMSETVARMNGKRLTYAALTANTLPGTVAEPDHGEPW